MSGIVFLIAQMPTPPKWKPPADLLSDTNTPWWLYGVAAGVIVLIAVMAWWLSRRRPELPDAPPPREVALVEIEALRSQGKAMPPDDFATAVCDALRQYFQEAFALPATRQTSQEFLAGVVAAHTVPGEVHAPLARFLEAADEARYGHPDLQEVNRTALVEAATGLVVEADRAADRRVEGGGS